MKDIKTREHDRGPKILEKASRMPKELAREAGLAAKEKSLQGSRVSDTADHPDSPVGYAGDKAERVLKRGAEESGRAAVKVSYAAGKETAKKTYQKLQKRTGAERGKKEMDSSSGQSPEDAMERGRALAKERAGKDAVTVSYTHLDVYKRQTQGSAVLGSLLGKKRDCAFTGTHAVSAA